MSGAFAMEHEGEDVVGIRKTTERERVLFFPGDRQMRDRRGCQGGSRRKGMYECVQKCRKICGLGWVNRARARVRVTQPSPHIFLHICTV